MDSQQNWTGNCKKGCQSCLQAKSSERERRERERERRTDRRTDNRATQARPARQPETRDGQRETDRQTYAYLCTLRGLSSVVGRSVCVSESACLCVTSACLSVGLPLGLSLWVGRGGGADLYDHLREHLSLCFNTAAAEEQLAAHTPSYGQFPENRTSGSFGWNWRELDYVCSYWRQLFDEHHAEHTSSPQNVNSCR